MGRTENDRMNPMHLGFEMLYEACNGDFHELLPDKHRIHGFAVRTKQKDMCYLVNKFEQEKEVEIHFPENWDPLVNVKSMVDTDDHWGKFELSAVKSCDNGVCTLTLP